MNSQVGNSTFSALGGFLPLPLWRKLNVLEGIILAHFYPPRVLFLN
ncbi:hypothetical protein B6N60_03166 [Richelia sinica FACHB-800]|uniref:Uncharacterized protein n=1 Tax=Richelia sinica FACHB-800 TaxID=1357546 RepID=A0A975TAN9_9NOST|nr:hypothetical protein B6N60_03166 [Richelia sinica FACHB-800]